MSVVMVTVQAAASLLGGNQDVTTPKLAGEIPSAVWAIGVRATTNGTAPNNAAGCYGASDGTRQWVVAGSSENNVNPQDSYRRGTTDELIMFLNPTDGTVDGEANFDSFIPNGIRITWGNVPAAAYLMTFFFWAGDEVSAYSNIAALGNVGVATVVNTVGFMSKVILFASHATTIDDTTYQYYYQSTGFYVNDGANTQRCSAHVFDDAVIPSAEYASYSESYAVAQTGVAALSWGGEVSAPTATGFTITPRVGNAGGDEVGYLCLNFNGKIDVYGTTFDTPIATGLNTVSGVGFEPQGAMLGLTQLTAVGTSATANAGSVGMSVIDQTDQYCSSVQDEDNQNPTDTQSLGDDQAINFPDDDGTAAHAVTFGRFTDDGWRWTFTATEGTAVKWWLLAFEKEAAAAATTARRIEATHHQALGLSVLAFKPTIGSYTVRGSLFDDQIASKMDALSFEKHADGGWWSAQITLNARLTDAEMWFEEGLSLNVEIYNPGLVRIFRGFVNQVDLTAGALSATRGPVLDIANRVSVTYTPILDATISPPIYGTETTTTIIEDTPSQGRHGIIEKVFAAEPGRCLTTQAEQQQATFLEELKIAKTSEDAGFSAQNVTQIVLHVLGYRHFLGAYIHQNTTAATVTISTKIQQVLASDPNVLFSTDYSGIDTNAFLVNQYENDNRVADDVIRDMVEIGGATSNERWLFGIYDEEKARYGAIPTTPKYQHRIADRYRRIERYGTGELVRPWDVEPGEFLFFPDFLIGRTQPTSLRNDPRYLFIESVTFSTPYEIQINGTPLSTIPQLLAKARTLE